MERRFVPVLSAIVLLAGAPLAHAQSPASPAPLSEAQVAVACSPALAPTIVKTRGRKGKKEEPTAVNPLRILGGQDTIAHLAFGPRDLVVISGGSQAGVQMGQEYFVRRAYKFGNHMGAGPRSVQTAGWVRIVAVNDGTSIAMIERVCESVALGDYLEPFEAPAAPALARVATDTPENLDFTALGRVMFSSEERRIAGVGDFMIVDRGHAQMAPGTRVAIYRDMGISGVPLAALGEGVVVTSSNGAPVVEITVARDAIETGDYIVPRK